VIQDKIYKSHSSWILTDKIHDYIQLGKLRLSIMVVFSAGMAYLIATDSPTDWWTFLAMIFGGLFVTLSANSLNEIFEAKYDAMMRRTADRPLATQRMQPTEAYTYAVLLGISGLALLVYGANLLSGLIGLLSLVLYSFIYTPLKRVGSIAVWVGAIPGALPVVIGWTAARGELEPGAWVLFAIQFIWQLPHFWAIAWVAFDDYRRAGYSLMPFDGAPNRRSAFHIVGSSLWILPASLLPYWYGISSMTVALLVLGAGLLFVLQAVRLYFKLDRKSALGLMFGSFLYLPVVFIMILAGKLF
jgi:heme o synthase